MNKIFEIVKTFELEPFQAGDGDVFRFRLEVLKNAEDGVFSGKVYRLETYRLQPTFPQTNGILPEIKNDAIVCVIDEVFETASLQGNSIEDVVSRFRSELKNIFLINSDK